MEKVVIVNGKEYALKPFSIKKISAAAKYLSGMNGGGFSNGVGDADFVGSGCKALSCLICGDETLAVELSRGDLEEVPNAISTAVKLLPVKDFVVLATVVKSFERLVANPRP